MSSIKEVLIDENNRTLKFMADTKPVFITFTKDVWITKIKNSDCLKTRIQNIRQLTKVLFHIETRSGITTIMTSSPSELVVVNQEINDYWDPRWRELKDF